MHARPSPCYPAPATASFLAPPDPYLRAPLLPFCAGTRLTPRLPACPAIEAKPPSTRAQPNQWRRRYPRAAAVRLARPGRAACRLLCAAAAGEASPPSPAPRRLVLYTKPGCCLCDGLKEKFHAAFLLAGTPYSLAPLELQERDITTDPEWERLYQYEIPVLVSRHGASRRHRGKSSQIISPSKCGAHTKENIHGV